MPTNVDLNSSGHFFQQTEAANVDYKVSVRAFVSRSGLAAYTRVSNVITANANGAIGAQDGVTLVAGNRVLLADDGVAHADHGIYDITAVGDGSNPYVLTRSSDADASAEVTSGAEVFVSEGTNYSASKWRLTTADAITLNTTAIAFTMMYRLPQSNQDWKQSVRAVTQTTLAAYTRTANRIQANANGALAAIDGITLAVGERMLLKNGAAGADNGIYRVTQLGDGSNPYILDRDTDADTSAKFSTGATVHVSEGSVDADSYYTLTTNDAITLNTTALTFAKKIVDSSSSQAISGKLQYGRAAATALTIATGAITVTQECHTVDTEASAAADDLDTISGGTAENLLFLRAANAARSPILKHGTGNIQCPGGQDIELAEVEDGVVLYFANSVWSVIGRCVTTTEAPPVRRASVTIPFASVRTLNATPYPIIAAPGAGKYIEVVCIHAWLDYGTAAYDAVGAGDELSFKYTDASGAKVVLDIEATGFGDAASDQHRITYPANAAANLTPVANAAVVAHILAGEWYAAAGDSPIKVEAYYRVRTLDFA